jgi:hypothetical protein
MTNTKYKFPNPIDNPGTVIVIDRDFLELELQYKEKGLLNKDGKLDDLIFNALYFEIVNHTSGFLEGCYFMCFLENVRG